METVIRVGIIYVFLLAALRLMGKREFSQLAPFELVTLLMIPEIVAQAMVRDDFSLTNAFIGVTTLLSLVFLTSVAAFLSRKIGTLIDGTPVLLVQHGRLLSDRMARERISPDELLSEMHRSGLETMPQVKWAVLEPDGNITIIPWESAQTNRRTEHSRIQ